MYQICFCMYDKEQTKKKIKKKKNTGKITALPRIFMKKEPYLYTLQTKIKKKKKN